MQGLDEREQADGRASSYRNGVTLPPRTPAEAARRRTGGADLGIEHVWMHRSFGGVPLAAHPAGFWVVVAMVAAFTGVAGYLAFRKWLD